MRFARYFMCFSMILQIAVVLKWAIFEMVGVRGCFLCFFMVLFFLCWGLRGFVIEEISDELGEFFIAGFRGVFDAVFVCLYPLGL